MTIKAGIAILAAAAIAITAGGNAAAQVTAATAKPAYTLDLSAQQQNPNDKKKKQGKQQGGKQQGSKQQGGKQQGGKQQGGKQQGGKQQGGKQQGGKQQGGKQQGGKQQLGGQQQGGKQQVKVFVPKGPNAKVVTGKRLRGQPSNGAGQASIRGRNFSTWRGGGYRVRHGNQWVTFASLGVLAAILIGEASYYPYAYISAPEDYCEGLTEDGCQLSWQDVETVDGDLVGQCVAYCPWQN